MYVYVFFIFLCVWCVILFSEYFALGSIFHITAIYNIVFYLLRVMLSSASGVYDAPNPQTWVFVHVCENVCVPVDCSC